MRLPPELTERLCGDADASVRGRLGNLLTKVEDREVGPAYLKVADGEAADDLDREAVRLRWIGGQLVVPDVLFHARVDGVAFLLLSALPGTPAHTWVEELGPRELLGQIAQTLRSIHNLDARNCPFEGLFTQELWEARERLDLGVIDRAKFFRAYGEPPEESLEWLAAHEGLVGDLVFTHGDFCLPNVLLSDGAVSGVVDWGLAGKSDRHRDFMSIGVTLRLNGLTANLDDFYQAYDPLVVDEQRIRLYATLDRFF